MAVLIINSAKQSRNIIHAFITEYSVANVADRNEQHGFLNPLTITSLTTFKALRIYIYQHLAVIQKDGGTSRTIPMPQFIYERLLITMGIRSNVILILGLGDELDKLLTRSHFHNFKMISINKKKDFKLRLNITTNQFTQITFQRIRDTVKRKLCEQKEGNCEQKERAVFSTPSHLHYVAYIYKIKFHVNIIN
ncbi:unnamed protein product [Brugia timori]|uniref:Uncharacterized protein n=1 Tax=Brugia timori TaxID=42155 RepID=A0A0R3R0Y8_9BILA|nr:unnamed protein product [Brugia timori]